MIDTAEFSSYPTQQQLSKTTPSQIRTERHRRHRSVNHVAEQSSVISRTIAGLQACKSWCGCFFCRSRSWYIQRSRCAAQDSDLVLPGTRANYLHAARTGTSCNESECQQHQLKTHIARHNTMEIPSGHELPSEPKQLSV